MYWAAVNTDHLAKAFKFSSSTKVKALAWESYHSSVKLDLARSSTISWLPSIWSLSVTKLSCSDVKTKSNPYKDSVNFSASSPAARAF